MTRRRTRGEGEVYREDGRRWAVRWREGARRRYKGGFDSKPEAERFLAQKRGEIAVRRSGMPADPRTVPALRDLAPEWLARRKLTHKAAQEDEYRWDKHLAPHFGHLRPGEVDHAAVRAFAESKLAAGLASGTVRVMVAILSSLFVDLMERGLATTNPGRGLPRSLSRMIRPSHDPRTTPFVERLDDVRRIFLALDPPLNIGYALGALAGLRPGEAFALRWPQVDLDGRRIHIQESVTGSTKDKDSRLAPILDPLVPVLKAWRLQTGGVGLVCPPLRRDGSKIDKGTRGDALRATLKALGLARAGFGLPSPAAPIAKQDLWYWCTRHTFASQWVMAGRSIEELKEILGHYSVVVTERYAHLRPDLFAPGALSALSVSLTAGDAQPVALGQTSASTSDTARAKHRKDKA